MNTETLAIEIGTEELPPRPLKRLAVAFHDALVESLRGAGLDFKSSKAFATPRRLGVVFEALEDSQPATTERRRGPALEAAFADDGAPTKAALGFAKSCGVEVANLSRVEEKGRTYLAYERDVPPVPLNKLIPSMFESAAARLPIPKRMRWGSSESEFIRPVHWLLCLYGTSVIEFSMFDIHTDRKTYGHRFHHPQAIEIPDANALLRVLEAEGFVMPDFDQRRTVIREQIARLNKQLGGVALIDEELLEEVTALVEWPQAIAGGFDESFLALPTEVLISTMQKHQRYFPVTGDNGALMCNFITVSNIESSEPEIVVRGNERVIRPRLADARFFYEQDNQRPLVSFRERLDDVVFEKRLGSLGDKTRRVKQLAGAMGGVFDAKAEHCERAAELSRCDLVTEMVGEFPDLQGIMGRYYAKASNEEPEIAEALGEFYLPAFAGDALPESAVGACIAVADKIDSLIGIFGVGAGPTGDKDPFALRRAANGLVRILIEGQFSVALRGAFTTARDHYEDVDLGEDVVEVVWSFISDRLRTYYTDRQIGHDVIEAVLALDIDDLSDVNKRVLAVTQFKASTSAPALAAANKRITNILKKEKSSPSVAIDEALFEHPEESTLAQVLGGLTQSTDASYQAEDYGQYLTLCATLKEPVDAYFDAVMVMHENPTIKANRIAQLDSLRRLLSRVADISLLD
ncbi:MAG: glycine--tRNA ligase subunit beta [Pseudomonadota bacterium]